MNSPTAAAEQSPSASSPVPASSPDSASVALATPAQAYEAAFTAREKKDVEGLKRVMSEEMLVYFGRIGQARKMTLDQVLSNYFEQPQAPKAETRNVRIAGNRAKLEFKDVSGQWLDMDFVKEGGVWKMTFSNQPRQQQQRPQGGVQAPPPQTSPAPQR